VPASETTVDIMGWEHFPHDADIGVRGYGATKAEAFANAALAMTAVITEPEKVAPSDTIEIACSAPDDGLLLNAWLNALIYEMATRRMLFGRFSVTIDGRSLTARASGEAVDRARHEPAAEVKGATLTDLRVETLPDGRWRAQCVVDV
jgi:SHS2 domain-containing protein